MKPTNFRRPKKKLSSNARPKNWKAKSAVPPKKQPLKSNVKSWLKRLRRCKRYRRRK